MYEMCTTNKNTLVPNIFLNLVETAQTGTFVVCLEYNSKQNILQILQRSRGKWDELCQFLLKVP